MIGPPPLARYLLRRLALSVAVLLGLLLLTFALTRFTDADPVLRYLQGTDSLEGASGRAAEADNRAYRLAAARLGVDRPAFFLWIAPAHYPDTLARVLPLARRRQAEALLRARYTWTAIARVQEEIWHPTPPHTNSTPGSELDRRAAELATDTAALRRSGVRTAAIAQLSNSLLPRHPPPRLHWVGADNAFVHHAAQFAGGGLGYSLQTGRSVAEMVGRALATTLSLGLLSLVVALLIAIPWGLHLARRRSRVGSEARSGLELLAYGLLSAPGFWVTTVAVTQLSGRGRPFPGPGWLPLAEAGLSAWLWQTALPLACLGYGSAAYLALVLGESLQREDHVPVRDFARMLGRSERSIWWRDMLPLGLVVSVVTAAGILLPGVLGASVVVEYLFNIPGLGRLTFESLLARDWPVVIAIVWLSGVMTVAAYTLVDLVNAALDPRWRKLVIHAV